MERRPEPEPLEMDERIPTGIGIVCWAIALVVLLLVRDRLPVADRWWIWTGVAGLCIGLFGFWYAPRIVAKREAARHDS